MFTVYFYDITNSVNLNEDNPFFMDILPVIGYDFAIQKWGKEVQCYRIVSVQYNVIESEIGQLSMMVAVSLKQLEEDDA